MTRAQLAGETDAAGFRDQARRLLAQGVPPDAVAWSTGPERADLFAANDAPAPDLAGHHATPRVPAGFVTLCEQVVLHREPQRFTLLYRLLWRIAAESAVWRDPLDPDLMQARRMARAVGHDMHKMRAFVRFREVADPQAPGGTRHVAWFEPQHRIVEANAPWFMRRFAQMHWAILTPDGCVEWDGAALRSGPGAAKADAPAADAGEQLWLTYYRSIFNPARLKFSMMRKEMPRRYWPNLPEAELIAPLAAEAIERSGRMIEQPASAPRRRVVPLARAVPDAIGAPLSLDDLAAAMQACRDCPIGQHATQAVMGGGPVAPALMLVGEQPGDQEDLRGEPFVGPAGQLLDRALAAIALPRGSVYLTNAVRHFKFELRGKRRIHKTPTQAEAAACAHWLDDEIRLVRPRALVALGATAARSLLGRPVAVTAERGRWSTRDDGLRVLVTWHPSALLRMEAPQREAAFVDFVEDLRRAAMDPGPSPG